MTEFVLYGLDDDGALLLTERFAAPDLAAAVARGAARVEAIPMVEIWQGSVCVFRGAKHQRRPAAGIEPAQPAVGAPLAGDPAAVAARFAASPVQALDVAVIATAADGTIAYWNPAAEALYGWRSAEAVGRNIVQVTPALQSRETAQEIMLTLQAGRPWAGEFLVRRRDGAPFAAFVADTPVTLSPDRAGVIVGLSAPAADRARVLERNRWLNGELDRLLRAA